MFSLSSLLPGSMAHDVFISYSSTDQPAALAVLHGLENAGIRCWIAPRDIPAGAIWAKSIMEGISGCRVLVVVFSTNANRSEHVINEVDAAVRKGAVIIPFRIEDVMPDGAMEYHLRTRHWLDALTPDLQRHTELLAEKIQPLLAAPSGLGPTPTAPPRPIPEGLPKRPVPKAKGPPRQWRRYRTPAAILGAIVLAGGFYLTRDRPREGVQFEVKEVSSSGGNALSVRVTGARMRFFEGPRDVPTLTTRAYADSFAVGRARYLYPELKLTYEAPGRDFTIPFSCTVTRDGGTVITTIAIVAKVQAAWTESYHTNGYGRDTPGWWQPGRHEVRCYYGEELIFRNWFRIVATGDAAPSAATDGPEATAEPLAGIRARVRRITLFPSGRNLPPEASQNPTTTFESAQTTYIGAKVLLNHDAPGRRLQAALTCRFLRDGTTEMGRATLRYDIQPTWTSTWAAIPFGRETPGGWPVGSYLIACDDGQRTLAQQRFTLR